MSSSRCKPSSCLSYKISSPFQPEKELDKQTQSYFLILWQSLYLYLWNETLQTLNTLILENTIHVFYCSIIEYRHRQLHLGPSTVIPGAILSRKRQMRPSSFRSAVISINDNVSLDFQASMVWKATYILSGAIVYIVTVNINI